MNDQDEMFEAATELPAVMGCPALGPKTLPSGFDGTEPAKAKVSDESKAKLEAAVARQREVLTQIADLALAAEAKSGNANVKLGSKFLDNSKAICAIRQLCGPDLVEKAQIESGSFYTPGWLCELAKKLEGGDHRTVGVSHPAQRPLRAASQGDMTGADKRKPTMDFGRFHVTRAAIPGTTILTFRRKREHPENFASVVPGRIIVAKITRKDVGAEKPDHRFTVKSYEAGEKPRVLFAGDSWVCMSKTEKMVYKMVKCDVKETQRRRISRKRKAAAKAVAGKQQAHDNKGEAAKEVK